MSAAAILLILITLAFLTIERIRPGRLLPVSKGWYVRSLSINLVQLLITILAGIYWHKWWSGWSFLTTSTLDTPVLEGFVGWFVGTFVFYWWHRVRHRPGFWQVFHQLHHSPSRIEVLTSFYKHPIEIACNSLLTLVILYPVLGVSVAASAWYNLFAATGEYFYHANVRTPSWLRYLIQTPELHSIHHQFDIHNFNFGDIPLWDRLFGTYKDSVEFSNRCGFPVGAEQKLGRMLAFRDVYVESSE